METSESWSRSFVHAQLAGRYDPVRGCVHRVGVGVCRFGAVMLSQGQNNWLFLLVGLLFAVIGPVIAWYNYYYGESVEIACGPLGFSVTTESRHAGQRQETYAWSEITATAYDETYTRSSGSSMGSGRHSSNTRTTTRHFTVDTTRGKAFHVTDSIRDFTGLVDLLNRMTPNLPYVWSPQVGYNFSIGPVRTGRKAYAQTARQSQPAVPAVPAAVAGATTDSAGPAIGKAAFAASSPGARPDPSRRGQRPKCVWSDRPDRVGPQPAGLRRTGSAGAAAERDRALPAEEGAGHRRVGHRAGGDVPAAVRRLLGCHRGPGRGEGCEGREDDGRSEAEDRAAPRRGGIGCPTAAWGGCAYSPVSTPTEMASATGTWPTIASNCAVSARTV